MLVFWPTAFAIKLADWDLVADYFAFFSTDFAATITIIISFAMTWADQLPLVFTPQRAGLGDLTRGRLVCNFRYIAACFHRASAATGLG